MNTQQAESTRQPNTEAAVANNFSTHTLEIENRRYAGTGGRSQENRLAAFRPAFFDTGTETIYASRFADGQAAPIHVLDGLPEALVLARSAQGRALAVRPSVISGFVRLGRFYTRDEAASFIRAMH